MVWSQMMMRFWNSASVAVHATLRRMSQKDDAAIVFHVCLISGVASFLTCRPPSPLSPVRRRLLRKATEADKTMGEICVVCRFECYLLNDARAAFLSL